MMPIAVLELLDGHAEAPYGLPAIVAALHHQVASGVAAKAWRTTWSPGEADAKRLSASDNLPSPYGADVCAADPRVRVALEDGDGGMRASSDLRKKMPAMPRASRHAWALRSPPDNRRWMTRGDMSRC
jgi:hypothetical protein